MIEIKLFKTSDDNNVVSKTLGDAKTYQAAIKSAVAVESPSFTIQTTDNLSEYNYCKIERYGRFYWAHITCTSTGLWQIDCNVDVLMSYWDQLKNVVGTVDRNENRKNGYLLDGKYQALAYSKIVTKKFPNAMNENTFILMTVG